MTMEAADQLAGMRRSVTSILETGKAAGSVAADLGDLAIDVGFLHAALF